MWLNWKRFSLGALLLASLSLLLFGCSDFGGSPTGGIAPTKTMTGVVSDPETGVALPHAKVTAYAIDDNGTVSDAPLSLNPTSATSNQNGDYLLRIPADYNGAVMVEAEVPSAKLVDRVTKMLALSSGRKIRSAVPRQLVARQVIPPVMVSLATDAVAQFVSSNYGNGSFTSDNIRKGAVVLETIFGSNFTQTPPPVAATNTNTTKAQQDLIVSIQAVNRVVSGPSGSPTVATIVTAIVSNTGLGPIADSIKNGIYLATTTLTAAGTIPPEYVPSAAINTAISNAQFAPVPVPVFADNTAPSAPANLAVSSSYARKVSLSWSASTDSGDGATGVAGYTIWRADDSGVYATIATVGAVTSYVDIAVNPQTRYSYRVVAFDGARNLSEPSNEAAVTTGSAADTLAPSAPAGLICRGFTDTQINLQWQQSTKTNPDGSVAPASGYYVYRNGALVATVADTAFVDTSVSPITLYSYYVKAFDANGNVSTASEVASVLTKPAPSPNPPAAPTAVGITPGAAITYNQVPLSWTASATPDVTYNVYRGAILVATGITGTSYHDVGVVASTVNVYSVTAVLGPLESAASIGFTATVPAAPATSDTTPPTVPANLVATSVASNAVSLMWSASVKTDGDGIVAGYEVYRGDATGQNMVKIDTVLTPGYIDTTVAPATTYSYQIKSFSTSGVHSAGSVAWVVTTAVAVDMTDVTAPSVPAGLATATAATSGAVSLTWTASTDNTGVAGYLVFRDGAQIADVKGATAYTDSSVAGATSYSYTVKAYDNLGNLSAASAPLQVTTPAAAPNTYGIYGKVTLNGSGVAGVTISNGTTTTVTDANGNYAFVEQANGNYTITATPSGYYLFTPTSINVVVNGANVIGQNFTAVLSGIVNGTVTYPDGTIIGGISYPPGSVIGGVTYPTGATVINGIVYPTGTVIGGITYPSGVVIGGVTYPSGTVVGGIAFPAGYVVGNVTYPSGVVIGGVIYGTGSVVGSATFPSGVVVGGAVYPSGTVSGGLIYPVNGVVGVVTYPTGTVTGSLLYAPGSVLGGVAYPTGSLTSTVTWTP